MHKNGHFYHFSLNFKNVKCPPPVSFSNFCKILVPLCSENIKFSEKVVTFVFFSKFRLLKSTILKWRPYWIWQPFWNLQLWIFYVGHIVWIQCMSRCDFVLIWLTDFELEAQVRATTWQPYWIWRPFWILQLWLFM